MWSELLTQEHICTQVYVGKLIFFACKHNIIVSVLILYESMDGGVWYSLFIKNYSSH